MSARRGFFLATCLVAALGQGAAAQDDATVTLRSTDGTMSVTGRLLAVEDGTFRLATPVGEISLDIDRVRCEGTACPQEAGAQESGMQETGPEGTVRLAVAPDLSGRLLPGLLAGFRSREGGGGAEETVASETLPTDAGLQALLDGTADLALTDRALRPRETEALRAARPASGPRGAAEPGRTLALDALVPVTAPGNPVEAISLTDLARAFAGEITDWSALGGRPGRIVPFLLAPQGGSGARVEALLMAPAGRAPGAQVRMFDTAGALAAAVARTPGALAMIGQSHAGGLRQPGLEDACGRLEPPSPFTVKSGDYPFVVALELASARPGAQARGRALASFLLSPAAAPEVEAAGYVSLSPMRIGLGEQGVRLANTLLAPDEDGRVGEIRALLTELRDAERLSTTLRMDPATGRPDTRSREEIARLARLLASGAFAGREVLFAGFTDSIGRADLNRDLSLRDAEDMRALVLGALPTGRAGDVHIATFGYGEISPVACNAHAAGRAVNRRVEVWLRAARAGEPDQR
ncbi:hypothetical protein FDP22_09800 [Paroceanicella profunda]|uniref:OmpA-like domain-containing protein n=1 Tax=Paroceanicella profunda TaxID=2579971 RepID=A0A5B8FZG3_9RHOB|nr:phosphate ABC transporter substrate-binding/OmpA family protein [Paroceanicella profunda]QDL92042.1 hypothetical protein FDP22_09800 [Paroceanicella profunda]